MSYHIIIIDDLREPMTLTGAKMSVYRTWEAGLDALKEIHESGGHVDELWLDHDLGMDPENGDEWNIMPVVQWLEEVAHAETPLDVTWIFAHTSNFYRGDMIVAALQKWYPHVARDVLPSV